MRDNGLGCGGWMLSIIGIVILWNVAGCVIGKIWDGTQEVLAERHAKQEVADARARERLARETAEKASAEARAAEARRVEAEVAEQRKREEAAQREAAERRAAAERREAVKMDKLRTFALQDAPGIWRVYQRLEAVIAEQNARIEDLAATLQEFDKDPDHDVDYKAICGARDEMAGSLKEIRSKLEEAYLASCRFKATPGRKEYADAMNRALEDGVREAEATARRYRTMALDK